MKHWYEYLSFVAAACLMMACSREGSPYSQIEGDGEPICFMTRMADQTSARATISVTDQFSSFRLFGVKKVKGELKDVFDDYGFIQMRDGVQVSGDATSGVVTGWEYASHLQTAYPNQSRQYWDGSASEYRMIAGAPYSNSSFNTLFGRLTLSGLDAGFEVVEGLTSTASADAVVCPFFSQPQKVLPDDYSKVVTMTFRYSMCRVCILVKFKNEQATPMVIKDVEFAPNGDGRYVNNGGLEVTYDFEPSPRYEHRTLYDDSDLTAGSLRFSQITIPELDTDRHSLPEAYWMLPTIPAYNSSWTVSLKVTPELPGLGEKEFSSVIPMEDMMWIPGYSYSYILELSDDGMDYISNVQAAIKDWTLTAPDNHDFYNW